MKNDGLGRPRSGGSSLFFCHRCAWIAAALVVVWVAPVFARITKSRTSPSAKSFGEVGESAWAGWYGIVVGSSVEYQSDHEPSEYGFNFLLEYNFTETLRLSIESEYASIIGKTKDARSISGVGDLERVHLGSPGS